MRRLPGIRRLWPFVLVVVVACMILLFGVDRRGPQKAKEAVLREDLWVLRDSIQQFYETHQAYPETLGDLVAAGYIRTIPVDPMTGSADTWITKDAGDGRGIADVRSGAVGKTIEGVPYSAL